jgi:hypothetical protein
MKISNKEYRKRVSDRQRSKAFEKQLDAIYKEEGLYVHRVYDSTMQKQGVDVLIPEMSAYIDEKVSFSSWGHYAKYRLVELTNRMNVNEDGWLFAKNHITTHYAFVFVRADDRDLNLLRKVDILIVPKKRLKSYLSDCGVRCPADAARILRYAEANERGYRSAWANGVLLTQSMCTPEKSMNARVSRSELSRMADRRIHWENPCCRR